MPVEDVGASRPSLCYAEVVVVPAIGEATRVIGCSDRRALGVRAVRHVVGGLVVTRVQVELVVDVLLACARVEAPVLPEEVDVPNASVQGIGDLHLKPGAGHDARGLGRALELVPRILRHERDLVVGVERGIGVRPHPGVRVGVLEVDRAVRRSGVAGIAVIAVVAGTVDLVQVHHRPLVDLNGDLLPLSRPPEGDEVSRRDPLERRDRRPCEHDGIVRAIESARAGGCHPKEKADHEECPHGGYRAKPASDCSLPTQTADLLENRFRNGSTRTLYAALPERWRESSA